MLTDKQKVWKKIEEMISNHFDYIQIEKQAHMIAAGLNVPKELILQGIRVHHAYEFRDVI